MHTASYVQWSSIGDVLTSDMKNRKKYTHTYIHTSIVEQKTVSVVQTVQWEKYAIRYTTTIIKMVGM